MVAGLGRGDIRVIAVSGTIVAVAGALHFGGASALLAFVVSAIALAGIAYMIGESTDQLGNHLGPAATGIIQSAVGNLPELFVCIFALRAGLVTVVPVRSGCRNPAQAAVAAAMRTRWLSKATRSKRRSGTGAAPRLRKRPAPVEQAKPAPAAARPQMSGDSTTCTGPEPARSKISIMLPRGAV